MARLMRDDAAVTEVIGYVLTFALSAIFLLISLNVFTAARANTEEVVTGVELKTIADRVAGRVVEAGLVSQEFPNATLNFTMDVPQTLSGRTYTVWAVQGGIAAATDDGALNASATTYKLDAFTALKVNGFAYSSEGRVSVAYNGTTQQITIRGG